MTCAFVDCAAASSCCLMGGCLNQRFQRTEGEHVIAKSKALNGTKPREIRDPRFIKRKRKALTP